MTRKKMGYVGEDKELKTDIMVKDINERIWLMSRAKAVQTELNMGKVINGLLKIWVTDEVAIKEKGWGKQQSA